MPKTCLRTLGLPTLLILILLAGLTWPAWAQPGGMGGMGGMGGPMGGGGMGGPMGGGEGSGLGGGQKRQGLPRFDMAKATTITGQVESLGSYGPASWRSLPGMAVQGLTLKTAQGPIEVYLGPPSYATKQGFELATGDTLKVKGFKVLHQHKPAFFAAQVKGSHQTLTLLDDHGFPLWKQQSFGGPGSKSARRGGRDPSQMGSGLMGTGNLGPR